MSEIGLNTIISKSSINPNEKNPEKIREGAKQFETLMIEQMLKAARESGTGDWTGTSDDATNSSMSEMAEEHLAQALAASGGFGLAKIIVAGLERK